jgi:hypothetical protein
VSILTGHKGARSAEKEKMPPKMLKVIMLIMPRILTNAVRNSLFDLTKIKFQNVEN